MTIGEARETVERLVQKLCSTGVSVDVALVRVQPSVEEIGKAEGPQAAQMLEEALDRIVVDECSFDVML